MHKYKIPIELKLPESISPEDIIFPKRNYQIEYQDNLERGLLCDLDSFIIDLIEKGVLLECMEKALNVDNFKMTEKELYVFMRRWGLIGNREDRTFREISKELGLKSCCEAEYYAKASIKRVYEADNGKCERVMAHDMWLWSKFFNKED